MKEFFASIYETIFGVFDVKYSLIFSTLYDYGGYIKLGLLFILIPLLFYVIFYFAWNFPYGKFWHWALWLVISCIVVFICTSGLANTEIFASNNQQLTDAINDSESGYKQYASGLPLVYSWINTGLALVLAFIYSLILKQFSKIQMHLPF
jgi:beta-lactamase regulating signal transducer with metallopeptidase domain